MAGKRMKNMENIISNKLVNISISLEDYIPLKVLINRTGEPVKTISYFKGKREANSQIQCMTELIRYKSYKCESAETEPDEDIMVWKLYLRKTGEMIWQLDLKLNIIGIKQGGEIFYILSFPQWRIIWKMRIGEAVFP